MTDKEPVMLKKKVSHSKDGACLIVDEVTERSMEGDSLLEKRINAYLTRTFIMSTGMPADECIREARAVISMVRSYDMNGR